MTSSPHLIRHLVQFPCILLTLLGDVVRFLSPLPWLPKTSFSANSSRYTRNATSSPGARPTPPVSS